MPLSLKPLHALFAAEAGGIDLRKPLSPAEVRDIEAAMDRYAVLVFRDQPLGQGEQLRPYSGSPASRHASAKAENTSGFTPTVTEKRRMVKLGLRFSTD